MSKTEPTIQKYMTCQPHAIEGSEGIEDAERMMGDLNIRHLPVMDGGNVKGIVSDRDIKMALSIVGADPDKITVNDICHGHPYEVGSESKLHEVAEEMATNHYGAAIVIQNDKLVGIFTNVDACRALSEVLQQRFHEH